MTAGGGGRVLVRRGGEGGGGRGVGHGAGREEGDGDGLMRRREALLRGGLRGGGRLEEERE